MKNKVKDLRKERGWAVTELARRADTSRQTIHSLENNNIKNPSGKLMFKIADAFKLPEREIFFEDDVTHEEQKTLNEQKSA